MGTKREHKLGDIENAEGLTTFGSKAYLRLFDLFKKERIERILNWTSVVLTLIVILRWCGYYFFKLGGPFKLGFGFPQDILFPLVFASIGGFQFLIRYNRALVNKNLLRSLNLTTELNNTTFAMLGLQDLANGGPSSEFANEIKSNSEVVAAIQALHSSLEGWNGVFQKAKAPCSRASWLKVMETYFREEAYDICRREIVTNARNFPFLLLGITQSLIDYAKTKGKRVHYLAFTPVKPKYWADWPRGNSKPRAFYEEWFISTFFRSLAMFVEEQKEHLVHRRYILCSNKQGSEVNNIGSLESLGTISKEMEDWWILPCSIPLTASNWDEPGKELSEKVMCGIEYYRELCAKHIDDLRDNCEYVDECKFFVPMKNINLNVDDVILKPLWDKWRSVTQTQDEIDQLFAQLTEYHGKLLEAAANNVTTKLEGRILNEFGDFVKVLKEDDYKISTIIPLLQKLDLDIASSINGDSESVDLWSILSHSLRMRETKKSGQKWQKLNSWFMDNLHSIDEGRRAAFYLPLTDVQRKDWRKSGLPWEFALWGIEEGNGIDWKLLFTSELSDPFKTTRLQLSYRSEERSDSINQFEIAAGIANVVLKKDTERFRGILNSKKTRIETNSLLHLEAREVK